MARLVNWGSVAMTITAHFEERAATRGLRRNVFHFILLYGVEVEQSGTRFWTIVDRALPPGIDAETVRRATGWVVVVSEGGAVLTCYRRNRAARYISRKVRPDRRERRRRA